MSGTALILFNSFAMADSYGPESDWPDPLAYRFWYDLGVLHAHLLIQRFA